MRSEETKKIKRWKVIETIYLFNRPWLTARQDKVELPSGKIMDEYYVLEYPDWVNVIAITEDNEFVIIQQYRHGIGEVLYELSAGCCEKDELPIQSAKRELLEETGYTGGEWSEYMTSCANSSSMNKITHTFLAKGVKKTTVQHLEDTEDIAIYLFTKEEVHHLIVNEQIKQSLMLAPLWKYFAEYPLV